MCIHKCNEVPAAARCPLPSHPPPAELLRHHGAARPRPDVAVPRLRAAGGGQAAAAGEAPGGCAALGQEEQRGWKRTSEARGRGAWGLRSASQGAPSRKCKPCHASHTASSHARASSSLHPPAFPAPCLALLCRWPSFLVSIHPTTFPASPLPILPHPPVQCCVCPVVGGALKPTTMQGLWCHSACLQWIPEV